MPSEFQEDRARERRAVERIGSVDHGRVATGVRALPFLAPARHVVADARVVLRLHKGYGWHQACAGSVAAYGADNLNDGAPADGHWSVQCVGTCEAVEPAPVNSASPAPHRFVDAEPFDPALLRIDPSSSPCTNRRPAPVIRSSPFTTFCSHQPPRVP
ncbi:pyridoxamine 5'-phosphate oxidase family protein [Streptomyces sp. bgisy031]|uniref:pyridoxamine 5'-phosphate oxidase family protein n=1 Tax=Streptomyces sp. bgisy031 TaxID=3413772 RepID=UPI003D721010